MILGSDRLEGKGLPGLHGIPITDAISKTVCQLDVRIDLPMGTLPSRVKRAMKYIHPHCDSIDSLPHDFRRKAAWIAQQKPNGRIIEFVGQVLHPLPHPCGQTSDSFQIKHSFP